MWKNVAKNLSGLAEKSALLYVNKKVSLESLVKVKVKRTLHL